MQRNIGMTELTPFLQSIQAWKWRVERRRGSDIQTSQDVGIVSARIGGGYYRVQN